MPSNFTRSLPSHGRSHFDTPVEQLSRRARLPAWLTSALVHTFLLTSAAFLGRHSPAGDGTAISELRTTGIALVDRTSQEKQYFDGSSKLSGSQAVDDSAQSSVVPLPSAAETSVDLAAETPSNLRGEYLGNLGANDRGIGDGGVADAGQLQGGSARKASVGNGTETHVYGITATGSRFVYVFDRSGSMSGFGGRPLRSAQSELLQSLQDLDRVNQFQIIFYNERPRFLSVDGSSPRLYWGDDVSKQLATRFVRGIDATGGTEHMAAITMALRLNPDVIFFLTDADEPQLSEQELRRIERLNQGATIHAIEFGYGPQTNSENFLVALARRNNGEHRYVDISELPE